MQEDLLNRALEGVDAFSRGDLDEALEGFSPDVVWEVDRDVAPDAEVYHGHDGVRRFWETWREMFDEFRLEIVESEALDDRAVLFVTRAHGTGAGSGVSIVSPEFVQLMEFRDDVVARVRLASSRRAAILGRGPC